MYSKSFPTNQEHKEHNNSALTLTKVVLPTN